MESGKWERVEIVFFGTFFGIVNILWNIIAMTRNKKPKQESSTYRGVAENESGAVNASPPRSHRSNTSTGGLPSMKPVKSFRISTAHRRNWQDGIAAEFKVQGLSSIAESRKRRRHASVSAFVIRV